MRKSLITVKAKATKLRKIMCYVLDFNKTTNKLKLIPLSTEWGVGGCPFCQTLDVFIKKLQKFLKLNEI